MNKIYTINIWTGESEYAFEFDVEAEPEEMKVVEKLYRDAKKHNTGGVICFTDTNGDTWNFDIKSIACYKVAPEVPNA